MQEIKVGIGDLNIAKTPDKLITLGLGSCIGIALIDSFNKIAGLSHIMLPDSKAFSNINNPMKYADTAIPLLVQKLITSGANKNNLKAKIAGGASMFSFADKSPMMDIGKRNAEAVKSVLKELNIPIIAEDIGGNKGRTMIVDPTTATVILKITGEGIKEL
ncbi:chemotaxis protein CheD [Caloramator proteoclasticus]|uniref:Probable chemoreceptor glutamine deamidase CheD n=1 Tax=Caloramator proteoclasticus DSM 10124 TaxID=1121262 RepID=A0A1M5BGC0_9CLOT|nr:chemotaxis protein CheD [Caloramator proteoclasticus]SHF41475.1 chemotaxis protein CheD [Caloramator proteoclasticus DSM 10124]